MGRSPCCEKNGVKKGPWTPEEDQKLIDYIQKNGYGNWRTLPKNAGLQRCGKSCRLRWTNYLRPDIKRGRFSLEEEETIIHLHNILGNKWSVIASRLPGRTDNEIKNYWNTNIRKKLIRMGIDPVTHIPRLDLLDLSNIFANKYTLSRFIGIQNLINPELFLLISSLLSSHKQTNQDFLIQNTHHIPQPLIQPCQTQTTQIPDSTVPFIQDCFDSVPGHDQAHQHLMQYPQNLSGFGSPGYLPVLSSLKQDYVPLEEYGCYGSGHPLVDPSVQSVLSNISTPSSSPTPLHSNSTYINSSTTEDEKESYCSDMFKFEIPDNLYNIY